MAMPNKLCGAPLRSLERFQLSLPGTTSALHTGILPSTKMVQQRSAIFSPDHLVILTASVRVDFLWFLLRRYFPIVSHDAMRIYALLVVRICSTWKLRPQWTAIRLCSNGSHGSKDSTLGISVGLAGWLWNVMENPIWKVGWVYYTCNVIYKCFG